MILFTRTAVCTKDCDCGGNGFLGFCKCEPAPGTRVIVRRRSFCDSLPKEFEAIASFTEKANRISRSAPATNREYQPAEYDK